MASLFFGRDPLESMRLDRYRQLRAASQELAKINMPQAGFCESVMKQAGEPFLAFSGLPFVYCDPAN